MPNINFRKSPYHLLLLAAIILTIQSFFINGSSSLDIHLHDAYFVFPRSLPYLVGAFLLTLLWSVYLLTRKILASKYLIWMHVVATLLLLITIYTVEYWPISTQTGVPYNYYNVDNSYFEYYSQQSPRELMVVLLFVAGQLFFIVNLLYSTGRYLMKEFTSKKE